MAARVLVAVTEKAIEILIGLICILIVITIVLEIQVQSRNRDIGRVQETQQIMIQSVADTRAAAEKTAKAADDSRIASRDAKKILQDAIAAYSSGTAINPQDILDGLVSIQHIEALLNKEFPNAQASP